MQTKKISLATVQGKLSRTEMKQIMAGRGETAMVCGARWSGGLCYCDFCSNGTY